jgi:hypothetical protein
MNSLKVTNKYGTRAIILEELLVLSQHLNDKDFVVVFNNLIMHRIERLKYKPNSVKKYFNIIHAFLADIGKEKLIDKITVPNQSDVDIDAENNEDDLELVKSYLKNSKTNLVSKIDFTKYVESKFKNQIIILECSNTLGLDSKVKIMCVKCKRAYWTTRRVLTNRRRACFCKQNELNGTDALTENRISADLVAL